MDERAHDPRATAPERVAQRDGTAVHVRNLVAEPELSHHEEGLHRERLVQLDEPEVLDAQLRAGERLPRRGDRAEAHRPRFDARRGGRDNPDYRSEAELLRLRVAHDEERRRTV